MPLEKQQVERLLSSVAATLEEEIGCDDCLTGMAEFAEAQLVGQELSAALKRVEAHIAVCPECAEEYGVLVDVLSSASEIES